MVNNESIFSLRLVIADFYMEKPVPGLDPCYSEFRGKEIKRVSKFVHINYYKQIKVFFLLKNKGTCDSYFWL